MDISISISIKINGKFDLCLTCISLYMCFSFCHSYSSSKRNAGAIFIGEYSSEPLGDYFAGPNHVLPTNGTAKFFSALSVDDFIKKSSIVYYSKSALRNIHKDIIQFATSEQLTAHANSIAVRFEDEDKE